MIENHLALQVGGVDAVGQLPHSSLKTRNAKKPNTRPRKWDGDGRIKLRNRTLKFGAWNVLTNVSVNKGTQRINATNIKKRL